MVSPRQPDTIRRALTTPPGKVLALLVPGLLLIGTIPTSSAQEAYDDHKNMMEQLGIKAIRRGPNPALQKPPDFQSKPSRLNYRPRCWYPEQRDLPPGHTRQRCPFSDCLDYSEFRKDVRSERW